MTPFIRGVSGALLLALVACRGERGEHGDAGPAGARGRPGRPGQACACPMAGTATDAGAAMQEPISLAERVRPQWVLRDRAGRALDAIVGPPQYLVEAPLPPRFGPRSARCVSLSWLGDRYIEMLYDLATGTREPCAWDEESFRAPWDAVFLDAKCEGTAYSKQARRSVRVQGVDYFTDGEPDEVDVFVAYYWVTDEHYFADAPETRGCIRRSYAEPLRLFRFRPVPDWVLNVLPDAPYTLTLEYVR